MAVKTCQQHNFTTYQPEISIKVIEKCMQSWTNNAEYNLEMSFKDLEVLHKLAVNMFQVENSIHNNYYNLHKNSYEKDTELSYFNQTLKWVQGDFQTCLNETDNNQQYCCRSIQYMPSCCNENDHLSIVIPECRKYSNVKQKKFAWFDQKLNFRINASSLFCQSYGYSPINRESTNTNMFPRFFIPATKMPSFSCSDFFYQTVLSKHEKNKAWASISDINGRHAMTPWAQETHCGRRDPRTRPWWLETIFNGKWKQSKRSSSRSDSDLDTGAESGDFETTASDSQRKQVTENELESVYIPRRITFIISDDKNSYYKNIRGQHSYQDIYRNVTLSIINRLRWNIKVGIFFETEPLLNIEEEVHEYYNSISGLYIDEIKAAYKEKTAGVSWETKSHVKGWGRLWQIIAASAAPFSSIVAMLLNQYF